MAPRLYLTNYRKVKAIKVTPKLTEHGLESSLANKRTVRWLDFYRDLIIHVLLVTFSCSHQPNKSPSLSQYALGTTSAPSAKNSSFLLTPVNTQSVPPSPPSIPN